MAKPFTPTRFTTPVVNPNTATLFRRFPYISATEYQEAPTAVATNKLVPNGDEAQNLAALAAVISRASDWLDTICFHRGDGTLAASPSIEQAWISVKDNGAVALICNYKPILEVLGVAIGPNAENLTSLENQAAAAIRIEEPIIWLPGSTTNYGPLPEFPPVPIEGGKILAVWEYVNGFPHTALGATVAAAATEITVEPTEPGGDRFYGVNEGTQLTIHDGANTEVIVVESVEEPTGSEVNLKVKLKNALKYEHKKPEAPNTTRVSAVPWAIEQACILLTSCLIKTRGARAMQMQQVQGKQPEKQVEGQAGATRDETMAMKMLQPYIVPVMRSTS